jgi:putative FmdB family regulatory protein
MPTYQYKCLECGHDFEMFQKMSDEPIKECPKCKGEVKRLLGAGAGPIFKGSGFYHTDYKNKSEKSEGSKTSKPKPSDSKESKN